MDSTNIAVRAMTFFRMYLSSKRRGAGTCGTLQTREGRAQGPPSTKQPGATGALRAVDLLADAVGVAGLGPEGHGDLALVALAAADGRVEAAAVLGHALDRRRDVLDGVADARRARVLEALRH